MGTPLRKDYAKDGGEDRGSRQYLRTRIIKIFILVVF